MPGCGHLAGCVCLCLFGCVRVYTLLSLPVIPPLPPPPPCAAGDRGLSAAVSRRVPARVPRRDDEDMAAGSAPPPILHRNHARASCNAQRRERSREVERERERGREREVERGREEERECVYVCVCVHARECVQTPFSLSPYSSPHLPCPLLSSPLLPCPPL